MMFYLIWIPPVILIYVLYAIASKKANMSPDWTWVGLIFVLNTLGLWPLVARWSKNLLLDGLIYDLIIMFTFYMTLIFLGSADSFNKIQWLATGLIVVGIMLFKLAS